MEQRRADAIATELEQMIFAGTFEDGARLDETRLAAHFGVSRTPLREAFQKLTVSGLVTSLPRRGHFVCHPSPLELLGLFEAMAELEAACGRLAATRISAEGLHDLARANAACATAVAADEADRYYTENARFHHRIYAEAGNDYLCDAAGRLHRRLQPFRRSQLRMRGRMAQSLTEHEAILAALRVGDSAAAEKALRAHVAVQGETFHHVVNGWQRRRA